MITTTWKTDQASRVRQVSNNNRFRLKASLLNDSLVSDLSQFQPKSSSHCPNHFRTLIVLPPPHLFFHRYSPKRLLPVDAAIHGAHCPCAASYAFRSHLFSFFIFHFSTLSSIHPLIPVLVSLPTLSVKIIIVRHCASNALSLILGLWALQEGPVFGGCWQTVLNPRKEGDA